MKRLILPWALLLATSVSYSEASKPIRRSQDGPTPVLAPLIGAEHETAVTGQYIVHFQQGYTIKAHIRATGVNVTTFQNFREKAYLPGYRASIEENILQNSIRRDPGVTQIALDQRVELKRSHNRVRGADLPNPASVSSRIKKRYDTVRDPDNVPYGLAMISSGRKLNDTVLGGFGDYEHIAQAGKDVDLYILDTGVRISHTYFGGHARNFNNLPSSAFSPYCVGETMDDTDGHGTHVAGIAGAAHWCGVAPSVNIWSVKVFCLGATQSRIADAVADVTAAHLRKKTAMPALPNFRGSIINLSVIVRHEDEDLKKAIQAATDAGISIFAPAGDDNRDAQQVQVYPCGYPTVNCVAAVDNNYARWWLSNYGEWVQFSAPGVQIWSLHNSNDTAAVMMDGTSMATAYVSGVAAIFTSWRGLANNAVPDYVRWNAARGFTTDWPTSTDDLFVRSGINSLEKLPEEPFRFGGERRHRGIVTSNVYNITADLTNPVNHTASFRQATTSTVSEARPLSTDPYIGPHDVEIPQSTSSTSSTSDTAKASASATTTSKASSPSWLVSAFDGKASDKGCNGKLLASSQGTGDGGCVPASQVATCLQAQTIDSMNPCAVNIFADAGCANSSFLHGGASGVFGQYSSGQGLIAGENQFMSWKVTCA